jgi:glycosyltransferase involved in cell wall biosynthesis
MTARTPRCRWTAVAWAPYSRRSEMFARELGGSLHCIHYLKFQSPVYAPFKYVPQAFETLRVLRAARPAAIHVQMPPFPCGLVVALYCRLTGARFVVEYHTAAFARAWRWSLPLQKLIARRAALNIVTDEHWARVVRSWGGRALVMYDAFLDLPAGEPFPVGQGVNVAYLSTFAADEPLEPVLEAAALLPEVRFYVTGDTSKAPVRAIRTAPPNVTFTGFLDPNGRYLGLLRAVDVAVVLTTRDHTLQLAGCEAIAVGKPLVTSDFAYLRALFEQGAVFVEPRPWSIRDGIAEVLARHDGLAQETRELRHKRREEWNELITHVRSLASGAERDAGPDVGAAGSRPAHRTISSGR